MKDSLTIRRASALDIPLIRRMADVAFRSTYRSILSPEQLDYMMDWMYSESSLKVQTEAPGKEFYLAEMPDGDAVRAVGYVSFEEEGLTPDGRKQFHLQKLYILPEFQGEGIGCALMGHVKERLGELCPDGFRIELNVNRFNKAVGFYERLGMVRDRQGDFSIGNGYFMNDYIYALDVFRR